MGLASQPKPKCPPPRIPVRDGCLPVHQSKIMAARRYNAIPRFMKSHAMTAAPIHPTQANAEKRYVVTRADLPLSCPLPSMALWNSHPRVYLPIEAERKCQCPYCGALFVLADEPER
jgi:uncharacterized Zn-finger protein